MGDDVVIVLRGLSVYKAEPHQVNLMWNISHPDMISRAEFETFDHVFVASQKYTDSLQNTLNTPVTFLPQCTDRERFGVEFDSAPEELHDLLFVGNSRNEFRDVVKKSVDLDLPIQVYGSRWSQFIGDDVLQGTYLDNEGLASYYRNCRAVLNDHWADMREFGFISNRLFDAAAAGSYIITDDVVGLDDIFQQSIATYSSPKELKAAAELPAKKPATVKKMREKARRIVLENHTFDHRASEILEVVEALLSEKSLIAVDTPLK
jgi:spore maturation protein CgeB